MEIWATTFGQKGAGIIGSGKPALKVQHPCMPMKVVKSALQRKFIVHVKPLAAIFHLVFQFQKEIRTAANMYFITDLKHRTMTIMMATTNILTLQVIFEIY